MRRRGQARAVSRYAQQRLGGGHLHALIGEQQRPLQGRLGVLGRLGRPYLGQVAERPCRRQDHGNLLFV